MAIARLSVGIGSKGKASPHAQYIAREGKYSKSHDDLEKLEFTGHGNMPKWAQHEPNYFWKMSDEHERKNGSTYREHVIALPRELTLEQRHDLILDWIEREISDKYAYQYAIHNPPAMDGYEQPHCHLMFSERTIDGIERDPEQYFKRYNAKNPEKGGAKKANTGIAPANRRMDLLAQRERWEQTCNAHLERSGTHSRISMKSLKAQGIEREPMNINMRQFKTPSIKAAYREWLNAKAQYQKALEDKLSIDIKAELIKEFEQGEQPKHEWISDAVARLNNDDDIGGYLAYPFLSRYQETHIISVDDNSADPENDHKFDEQQQKIIEDFSERNQLNRLDTEDVRGHLRRVIEFFSTAKNIIDNQYIIDLLHKPQKHRKQLEQPQKRIQAQAPQEDYKVINLNQAQPRLSKIKKP